MNLIQIENSWWETNRLFRQSALRRFGVYAVTNMTMDSSSTVINARNGSMRCAWGLIKVMSPEVYQCSVCIHGAYNLEIETAINVQESFLKSSIRSGWRKRGR